ncbi:MAG: hypothetical protein B6245_00195 [Desulfobacteraceae bacterium 4572_88]|nr:MAG: hypothetical protein B6245_00195 [Desulfobacteraceae bacterium 4572_88]
MSDHLKWKKGLLSSSLPLEWEISRQLVSEGFVVHSDYKYSQSHSAPVRSAPVDLCAKAYMPFRPASQPLSQSSLTAQLELLIECRHRNPDKIWLFLPDPNLPEVSPARVGNTLRVVDKFSSYVIESEAPAAFDMQLPLCQKGLEIDSRTGDIDESVLRNALLQLQYALPRLLTENVLFYLVSPSPENIPFLFCPVILTNTQLFVLNRDTDSKQVEACSEIRDIAAPAPYLTLYLNCSADFEAQCMRETLRLKPLQRNERAMVIERRRARHYQNQSLLPFTIIDALTTAEHYHTQAFFTQFIVCSNSHFAELLEHIRNTATSALSSRLLIES